MNAFLKTLLLFCAVVVFLVSTAPSNHCEAEDSYYYAWMAEQGGWSELFHQHHLLYLPVARGIYRTAQMFGFAGRAMPVLIGLSTVSAAAVICLFAAMLGRRGIRRWWVLPLLFSYGFWRYACAAEIYLPSLAAVCVAWFFASQPKGMPQAVCCSAFALLLHLVCLPAVVAAGLLFIFRKEWRRAGIFYLSTGLAVAAVYGLVQGTVGTVVFRDAEVVRGSFFSVSTGMKALVAFGQNLLSGNFLFSIPAAAERLSKLFPNQMLQEELFMGGQAGAVWQIAGMVTFVSALLLLGFSAIGVIRNRKVWWCPMAVWFAGNVAMALLFEPANPEMWIFVLLPFWFLVANAWKQVVPVRKFALPVLATAMLLHNAVGGIAFVKSEEGDYCRQKAAWIIEQARPGDLILSADSHSFVTFLEYQTGSQVVDAKFVTSEQWAELKRKTSGRIFVFGDLVELPPPVLRRTPSSVLKIQQFSVQIEPGLRLVHNDSSGAVYQWENR
jgi:hypothetical protein